MGREYSSSIYSGASGVWDGSTVVLYIVEHLECETGVQQFYIIIEEHLERGTGVQQFYI